MACGTDSKGVGGGRGRWPSNIIFNLDWAEGCFVCDAGVGNDGGVPGAFGSTLACRTRQIHSANVAVALSDCLGGNGGPVGLGDGVIEGRAVDCQTAIAHTRVPRAIRITVPLRWMGTIGLLETREAFSILKGASRGLAPVGFSRIRFSRARKRWDSAVHSSPAVHTGAAV